MNKMKVYVITKAKPFSEERFIGVASSKKKAEKVLRKQFPYMRLGSDNDGYWTYTSDAKVEYVLFIREEEVI